LNRKVAKKAGLGVGFVLLAVLPFLGALAGDFVWDDHDQIELNRHLEISSLAGYWLEAEQSFAGVGRSSRYNPLGWSVFVIENLVSGGVRPPALFHATSLAAHGLASLLLLLLLFQLVPTAGSRVRRSGLLAIALLFAWSPIQSSVVSWPSARFESLAVCCLLGGALLVLRSERPSSALLGGLLAALSLFAKESALGPLLLLPTVLLISGERDWASWRARLLACVTGVAVGTACFFGLRSAAGVALPEGLSSVRPADVLLAELRLLHLAVWPSELSLLRPLPSDAGLGDLLAGGGLALALVLGIVHRSQLAGRLALAGALVLSLATVPGALASVRFELLPDRYVYIGHPGLCLLLVALGLALQSRDGRRSRGRALAGGLVGLGLLLCCSFGWDIRQTSRWTDDVALFAWEVERWPDAPQTHYHLGLAYRMAGDHRAAEAALQRATVLGPTLWQTWSELAVTALDLGDYEQSEEALSVGLLATGGHPRLQELLVILPAEGERRGLRSPVGRPAK